MKAMLLFLSLSMASSFLSSEVKAQDYAASLKVGTQGVSLEGYRSLSPIFNVRLGAGLFSFNANNVKQTSDYRVDGDLNLLEVSALADWFPFENSLRVIGGLVVNLNKASVLLTPTVTKKSGNIEYTPERLGLVTADISFDKVAPYIGMGLGNPTSGASGVGFTFDIGTFYQGKPNASMSGTKLLTPMESQGPVLQDNIKWFQFYPVLSFGIYYKF